MAASATREATEVEESKQESLVRFKLAPRIEHLALMTSFTMLALTGLAEKYFQAGWAQWVISVLGGIDGTRLIHRIFAFVFAGGAVYHMGFLTYHLLVAKGPPSMVPTGKDATDAVTYLRYCLGLTNRVPQYDRYDFRQKFEYWGIIFGGMVMLFSGAILMWPVWITKIFPGALVPAAKEFHSNEAMLALLTIVV